MKNLTKLLMIIFSSIFTFNLHATSLSYMIKNDEVTESYIKFKNQDEAYYLKFFCNNFYNDIEITLEGLDDKKFFSKNFYDSKIIFGKKYTTGKWVSNYDSNGVFSLKLKDENLNFAQNMYKEGKVLIDLPELGNFQLYSFKNKPYLQDKLSSVFENCSIYF